MSQVSAASRAVAGASAVRLRVLHVILQAGPTNSQWNEHCLPVADERELTVCSVFPATVEDDPRIARFEGDGSVGGGLRALRSALRAAEYDAVHVHAPPAAAMLLAASVLERRGIDDVVLTLHTSWPHLRPRSKALMAGLLPVLPRVVACSRASAASVPAPLRRLARNAVEAVQNGVDVDRVDRGLATVDADPSGMPASPSAHGLTFLNVGRLITQKDPATLVRAFAHGAAPDDRLVLVGDGPLRQELEWLARDLGVADRVHLTGLVARDEVYRLLAVADVYVSPSRGEGLPVAVLEAMAARLPVVLSDIPPHREIVGDTGLTDLVPVGDAAALASSLRRIRTREPQERADLGRRGRELVLDHFSLRSMSEGYHRTYTRARERAAAGTRRTR